jgi:hypothetical protein
MPKDDPDHERAARAAAELKQTEQLLAGFDRPARTPRTPAVRRDFVEYHVRMKRSGPGAAPRRTPRDPKRAAPTFVIRRHGGWRTTSWALRLTLLVGMPVGGMLVAYWALGRQPAPAPLATTVPSTTSTVPSTTSTVPSTTSTIATTSAQVPPPATPPAAPPTASMDVAPPQGVGTQAPSPAVRPSPRASSPRSNPSNADFIKEL